MTPRDGLPLAAFVALKALARLKVGTLSLGLPDGSTRRFSGSQPGPEAALHVRDWHIFSRVLSSGDMGFAEGYMAGEWDSPDLVRLLELMAANEAALGRVARASWWRRQLLRLAHLRHDNTRRGSRRNIHAHYDLGNAFYSLWLDPTMTYSSALYDGDSSRPLDQAQRAKYERILDRLGARQGDSLLEIGCGWGGFAETAARRGVRVRAITISQEQLAYTRERLSRAGLGHIASVEFRDYRDVEGTYDHIVSIEMIEAVGERHWPSYFDALKRHLNPGGRAVVQAITIADDCFERYRRGADFIQTYIFPGGMLPSAATLRAQARRAGMALAGAHEFGRDYARTLEAWLGRFDGVVDRVRGLGFDDRFVRMWRYYLAYCAAGFASGRTDVVQAEFTHS
jgi:cyclopropane-fatty-acyl-phospholipid synthase